MPPKSRASRGIGLNRQELKDLLGLSGILSLRMLGLFLVLPVLSVYALSLPGATPLLAGLAVGAYGLSQTFFQVPIGMISDRLGRKVVIAVGLVVFAAGSVLAARADGIWGLLAGRLLQGAGAIASVAVALVADLTREEVRGRAMAFVGMSIGMSFALGFLIGPLLAGKYGVPALFWLTACLAVAAIGYLFLFIPEPVRPRRTDVSLSRLREVLADRNLLCLSALMFLLHAGMTAVFTVVPVLLVKTWAKTELWKVFAPMILIGGGLMLPAMMWAETRHRLRTLLLAGVGTAAAGFGMLFFPQLLVAGLIIYFVGFNFMEPVLPSLVTRFSPAALRGTALGFFNMSQFLGAFCGGALGGIFLGAGPRMLFPCLLALCVPWAAAALFLDDPNRIREAKLKPAVRVPAAEVRGLAGVYDARWLESGELSVRFSSSVMTEEGLRHQLARMGAGKFRPG